MNPVGALEFLINQLVNLYVVLIIARFLLQLSHADFYNPVSQFIVKATNPVLVPLRRLIPGYGGFDVASLVLALALLCVKLVLLSLIHGLLPHWTLLFLALQNLASLIIYFFYATIFIMVILSWIMPDPYHPVASIIRQINEPLLGPFRRLIPPMGGFDISPIFAILLLQVLQILFQL